MTVPHKLTLGRAIAIAALAHQDQMDRNGVDPYILHPLAVMNMLDTEDEKIVGVLHDVIEDTATSLRFIEDCGATPQQLEALDALTRRTNETYRAYLLRALNTSPLSRRVKLADHEHNSDETRLAKLPPEVAESIRNKYKRVEDLFVAALLQELHNEPD